jgi:7-cyano-7-deazaguanine synthase in queuosine biosynthesis
MGLTEQEMTQKMIQATAMYLLYERKNETQLRIAFHALVQERHNAFHTDGGHKKGDGSSYEDCDNEICKNAAAIIRLERKPEVEINKLTTDMLDQGYILKMKKLPDRFIAYLDEVGEVVLPENDKSNLILKI